MPDFSAIDLYGQNLTVKDSTARTSVSNLTNTVNGLSTKVTNVEGDITTINENITDLQGKTVNISYASASETITIKKGE